VSTPGLEHDPRLTKRTALRFFAVGLAVDATVIGFFALNPTWLQYFYSAQFPVLSRLIFGVFFFGLAITYRNFIRLLREEGALRTAVKAVRQGATPDDLLEQLRASGVRDRVAGLLARPAHAGQADPAGRDALEAREETHAGWAKYITGVLTMLGLLGTFLGLMVSIDSIRGLTDLQDKEAFFAGVVGALDGMGTAFSTSLAGIFGAVVLGFEQLVFHFAQLSFLTRLQLLVERILGPKVEQRGSAGGLAVEMHRLRQDLRAWRTDAASAGADLAAAASELGGQVRTVADSTVRVLEAIQTNDDRWREVSEELASLRRVAVQENQSLLALAGHRVQGLEDAGEGASGEVPEEEVPEGLEERMGGMLKELQRSNDLLSHIYREMGLVLRAAAQRSELRQTETLSAIARIMQRMDAQAATGAEQIALLKALLRYVNDDDRRLAGVMGILREEAGKDEP
jgi:biopolymer transport protein ExbB/TolQ